MRAFSCPAGQISPSGIGSRSLIGMSTMSSRSKIGTAELIGWTIWPGLSEWLAGALVGLYQDYRRSGTDGYAAQVTDTVRCAGSPAVRRARSTTCSLRAPASHHLPPAVRAA
jgi:hypothetical protein